MKQYDAYLFDWDGTLADTVRLGFELMEKQCKKYGLYPTTHEMATYFGDWTAAIHFGLPEAELDTFNYELRKAFHNEMSHPPLHDDALLLLQTLKARGKKLALITSSFREVVTAVLVYHQVAELFSVIITAQDVAQPKPDPEGIQAALRACGVDTSQALMLGDSDRDLIAANNAGVDSLLFYPAAHNDIYDLEQLNQAKPRYIIHSWRELLDQLQ
jgi:HAD superfamily hydrolase (TIGR01509 family)